MINLTGKTVLFDIDDTLSITSYRWMEYVAVFMSMNGYTQLGGLAHYGFEKSFNIPEKELPNYRAFMNLNFPYDELEVIPGMDRVVRFLIDKGATVKFITNRRKEHLKATRKWLAQKIGIDNPHIYFTSNDTVEELLVKLPRGYLIDNSLKRCAIAKRCGFTPILSNCICIDNIDCSEADKQGMFTVKNAAEIVNFFISEEEENIKVDEIKVGDFVTISNEHLFDKAPWLPKGLMGKALRVIDLYRDPKTNKLLRVSVTCSGIDNPKSKYNCFYISGRFVKKETHNVERVVTKPEMDKLVSDVQKPAHTYFISLNGGKGVKRIVPVTFRGGEKISNTYDWVYVRSVQGDQEFLVKRNQIFEDRVELFDYIAGE